MIDFAEATRIAERELAEDKSIDIVITESMEREYGWVFFYNSRKFMDDGNDEDLLLGNPPFLVQKHDGKIVVFSTGYPTEWYLTGYEAGFQSQAGVLTIEEVSNAIETINFLLHLNVSYVIPEYAYGEWWRIGQNYTIEQLEAMLETLPAVFQPVRIFDRYETFLEMDASGCCRYQIDPL